MSEPIFGHSERWRQARSTGPCGGRSQRRGQALALDDPQIAALDSVIRYKADLKANKSGSSSFRVARSSPRSAPAGTLLAGGMPMNWNELTKKVRGLRGKEQGHRAHEAEGGASGALAGAVLGAGAGPPGMVAGAVIGSVAGALAGGVLDRESSKKVAYSRELDAVIGVSEGELGAPNLKHPPARIGAYSAASTGAASSPSEQPAEGPIQAPEDE